MSMSIVIPFRNAEKTVQRCVNSILQQNIDDLQIILVNDHSSDNSVKVCEELIKDKCIILVDAIGYGVSSARNTGLKYASKEIIGFCDSDDYFEEDTLNKIQEEFQNQTIKMVISGYYKTIINERTGIQSTPIYLRWNREITVKQAEKLVILDDRVLGSVCNKFYRSTLIRDIYFDENLSYCEDMHFNCQLLCKLSKINMGKAIKIVPFCTYHYVANPKSVTNTWNALFDENNELKYIMAMNKMEKIPCISKHYVQYKKFELALNCFINFSIIDSKKKQKLLQTVKENHIYFARYFFMFPCKNIKLMLRGIQALLEMRLKW